MARRFQVNPFDLLHQAEPFPIAVSLPGIAEPRLSIAWNSFHQNFFSELAAFFRWTRVPKDPNAYNFFRDCRLQFGMPGRAILAAALWHVVFFIVPWPALPRAAQHYSAFDNTELTWSGPIEDLPWLKVPKHVAKHAKAQPADPPEPVTEAYHPRQRIYTDPSHPTHPRQTLVRPKAPADAPKFLAPLPNMVQLSANNAPARPRLEISGQSLAKLRPREVKHTMTTPTDAPNLEARLADLSVASIPVEVERPKLQIEASSAPRVENQRSKGDSVAAPELSAGTTGAPETIIALSSSPAAPAPVVEVPKGNLAARVAMSPEGKGTGNGVNGVGGADAGSTAASEKNSVGISISGGNPKPNASLATPGALGKLSLPSAHASYKRPDANSNADDAAERTGPPNFAVLPPGAAPEKIFASHRVYSLNINMPNLNSATGSWIIHFAELHLPGAPGLSGELAGPSATRTVDPKYPQDAIQEHIQGEVILYAIIRQDGSVDAIQLVRGIDKQLDANAVAAFAQWKFTPAMKGGQAVPLEAIVHIPFRGPAEQ